MEIKVVKEKIELEEVKRLAKEGFGDMVKAVVDIEKEVMALGGELHADANEVLLKQGSERKNVWGIIIYPDKPREEWIEFDSLINIRPAVGNRSRGIESKEIQRKITTIVDKLVR